MSPVSHFNSLRTVGNCANALQQMMMMFITSQRVHAMTTVNVPYQTRAATIIEQNDDAAR